MYLIRNTDLCKDYPFISRGYGRSELNGPYKAHSPYITRGYALLPLTKISLERTYCYEKNYKHFIIYLNGNFVKYGCFCSRE